MASALDGITVLDLTDGPAGAQATMLLGDHGARVVRIVGDGDAALRSGGYLVWDRGKECIRLDLSLVKSPSGRRDAPGGPTGLYESLVQSADVLVESIAPSSSGQALVDYDWLSSINPRLIRCSITGYGKRGPLRDEPPVDDLVMARMGILSTQPGFRPAPVHVVHSLPSVGAALLAAQGIAAALLGAGEDGPRAKGGDIVDGWGVAVPPQGHGRKADAPSLPDSSRGQRAVLQRIRMRRRQLGPAGMRPRGLHRLRRCRHGDRGRGKRTEGSATG